MNIIANDCAGAYMYQDQYKCDFMNPFIWSSINIENFQKLIKLYDVLDFKNIESELIVNTSGICKQNSLIPKLIIDNKIEVNYFHYIQNEAYKTPTKVQGYTMYNNIEQYTVDCYERRLNKMTERPIFIWDVTKAKWYNMNNIKPVNAFKNISDYTIVVYSLEIQTDMFSNPITLHKSNDDFEVNQSAANIYKLYLKNYNGKNFII